MLIFLNQSTTQQLIREKFLNIKIAVIGDLMLDRSIWGSVSRISPEAPVPVVRVNKKTVSLGGAGNVACNLATLGCQVHLLGVVGADIEAESLTREMLNLNILTQLNLIILNILKISEQKRILKINQSNHIMKIYLNFH